MTNVTKRLSTLFKLIQEEAEQNEVFRQKLENIFDGIKPAPKKREKTQPKLDPIALAIKKELGEASFIGLTEQELKVVIAFYQMNPIRKKLKTREAMIALIIEKAYKSATSGDVFLRNKS